MDDDEVDLNQDWFHDDDLDQPGIIKATSPLQSEDPSGSIGEYTSLNVPLDDEYLTQSGMLQGSSQTYQQQQQQQSQQKAYQQQEYEDSSEPPFQRIQQPRAIQNENYNYGHGQQPPPNQQFQIIKSQQPANWDVIQKRPDSQLQMRPDSRLQMRPDSQMHNQPFYSDQQVYTDSRSSNKFSTMQPIQVASQQQNQGRLIYKPPQQQYTSNTQYVPMDGQFNQQQSGVYLHRPFQHMEREGSQRLSDGMDSMMQISDDHLSYNTVSSSGPKRPPNRSQTSHAQTGNMVKQRKAPPPQPKPSQMIIQQPGQFIPNNQLIPMGQPQAFRSKKKAPRKVPTLDDIMSKFSRVGGLQFERPEDSAEFSSILIQLQNLQSLSPDERTTLSDRLDRLFASADVSQTVSTTQTLQDSMSKPSSKSRKKPPSISMHQIETQPPGYILNQQVFTNQPLPQISSNQKTIILDYGNTVYSTTGSSTTYQPQSYVIDEQSSFDQGVKKPPARKRPPKKSQTPQAVAIPVESLQNVVQTTNHLGQQILICTQPGTNTINQSVMISYDPVYGAQEGQQIVLQYQPVMATQIQRPLVETPKEMVAKMQRAQNCRENKVSKFFDILQDKLRDTDYITPFKDITDVVDRLLPFSLSYEPDYTESYLEKVDREIFRRFVHLEDRYDHLVDRFHNIYLTEAITEDDHAYELNMLLYLDGEYERRRFEQDKIEAKKDLDSFLRESEIIRAGVDSSELEAKKQQLVAPSELVDNSAYGMYEYNDFDEEAFSRRVEDTQPSPPKPTQKTKKRREKSRYLYASDLDDSEEDEEEEISSEEEDRALLLSKRDKPPSVTELIDVNAINASDVEPESPLPDEPQTPDKETIAANEQTEVINKVIDMLPFDLEAVEPSIFEVSPDLQRQSSTNFPVSCPPQHKSPPSLGMPSMVVGTQPSFIPSSSNQIPSHSITTSSTFDNPLNLMKTPPSSLPKPMEYQQSMSMNFPSTSGMSQFPLHKEIYGTDPRTQMSPFAPSPQRQRHHLPEQIPMFTQPQPLLKEVPPALIPPRLNTQMQPPVNLMKSSPPPLSSVSGINNNIASDKFDQAQTPTIPKMKPINVEKNMFLDSSSLKMPNLISSILKPPSRLEQPPPQSNIVQPDKLPQKPLEPPSVFDDSQLLRGYNMMPNQFGKDRPAPKFMSSELLKASRKKSSSSSSLPKTEVKTPLLTTAQTNQPKLAAVSMNERARMINSMKEKMAAMKSKKHQSESERLQPPASQAFKPNITGKKHTKVSGMEDSDDEVAPTKRPSTQQTRTTLDLPAPLDVNIPQTSSSIPRPSPSNALPVRLRFKLGNNGSAANGNYSAFQNDVQQKKTSTTSPSSSKQPDMPKLEPINLKLHPNKVVEDEKERKRKEEKKQRKLEKKLKREKQREDKQRPSSVEIQAPLKLKIRIGKQETVDRSFSHLAPSSSSTQSSWSKEVKEVKEIKEVKEEPKVPRLKIKFGKLPGDKAKEKSGDDSGEKSKKAKKRHRSPQQTEASSRLFINREESGPKVPRLKIKFGGRPEDPNKLPNEVKELPKMTNIPDISRHAPTTFPQQTSSSTLPPLMTSISMLSRPPSISFMDLSPVSGGSQPIPLLTPAAPDFSDEEMDDPNSDQLKRMTSKLLSSLTRR